jgi:hypothetical protein
LSVEKCGWSKSVVSDARDIYVFILSKRIEAISADIMLMKKSSCNWAEL